MSRAFVKEDVDLPERSVRRRSGSGLPPGAVNYLTSDGAARLKARLRDAPTGSDEAAHLAEVLNSATVVEPTRRADAITFGAHVILEGPDGQTLRYRIVGVDELDLDAGNVSWISPLGKALLEAVPGQKIALPGESQPRWLLTVTAA